MKLDIGCGTKKKDGFTGVDIIEFPGVDFVIDVTWDEWPWEEDSIDEIYSSHFIEHLEAKSRIFFVNSAYSVLKRGSILELKFPIWSSSLAYGDLTHKWPPVSEAWFNYLNKEWRMENAPHTDSQFDQQGYDCNFSYTLEVSINEAISGMDKKMTDFGIMFWKESVLEMTAKLTKL